jgi:2-methylisocitrate lyase-like PEP mutase family enzyme
MNVRKKLKAIMAGKRLVLMPGAYDALSARIIEAEGFEAICAGGYAAIGSMLAQPDMGQSNMRDYADHYGRICAEVDIPVYADADTGFGGVNNVRQMVRAFEAAGVVGVFISDQVFPNRCGYLPGKQVIPTEQMLAKIKARSTRGAIPTFSSPRAPMPRASTASMRRSSAAGCSWTPVPIWPNPWASTASTTSSASSAKSAGRIWRRCRRPRD